MLQNDVPVTVAPAELHVEVSVIVAGWAMETRQKNKLRVRI